MDLKLILLIFIAITPLCLGKPLCDSLEDYFRNSKQPGAKRFKKTITRICTLFDVVKFPGVDPIELILPPAEDDDDIGTQDDKRREKEKDVDDEDFFQDYDLPPHEASRFRFPGRWPMTPVRYRPWSRYSSQPRSQFQVSNRRHHRVQKIAPKIQSVKEKEKVNSANESAEIEMTTPMLEIISKTSTSNPVDMMNDTDIISDDNEYVYDDDYLDDDDNDPVLTDLADFVASVRFLSLNDTTHLNVIFPLSKKAANDKIDSGKAALAIEAPEELLPSRYRDVFPQLEKDSSLPEVYRIYTEFSCDKQLYKPGVYADLNTECQAFHLCLPVGQGFKSATFLCPRKLQYNQRLLKCDWAGAVNCSESSRHFINNKHFRHNYTAYLQSLRTLLHGDGLDSAEEMKDSSPEVTALLGKLRRIMSSE